MCEACLPGPIRFSRRSALSMLAAAPLAVAVRGKRRPTGAGTVAVSPSLQVIPRDAWGADRPPRAAMGAEDVRFLLVHHTAGPNSYAPEDVPAMLRGIYDFHTGPQKGWPDVCYHFFVDRFGGVWEGRAGSLSGPVVADATGGNQGFAQLVCLLGDFTSVMPTDAAVEATVQTLAWLAGRYGVDTTPTATVQFVSRGSNRWSAGELVTASTVSGHRDMSATACPGDTFYPYVVSSLRDRVHALTRGAAAPDPPSGAVPATTPPAVASTDPPATSPSPSTTTTTTTAPPPTAAPTTGSVPPSTTAPATMASVPATTATVPTSTAASAVTTTAPEVTDAAGSGSSRDWLPPALIVGGAAVGAGALAVRRRQS